MKKKLMYPLGVILTLLAGAYIFLVIKKPQWALPWREEITWSVYCLYGFLTLLMFILPSVKALDGMESFGLFCTWVGLILLLIGIVRFSGEEIPEATNFSRMVLPISLFSLCLGQLLGYLGKNHRG